MNLQNEHIGIELNETSIIDNTQGTPSQNKSTLEKSSPFKPLHHDDGLSDMEDQERGGGFKIQHIMAGTPDQREVFASDDGF